MKYNICYAKLPVLALGLALTACGGGGSVSSTPTPTPTPTPSATYQTFDELSGDQTFQTAGTSITVLPGDKFQLVTNRPYGAGIVSNYTVSPEQIVLTFPDNSTSTFDGSNLNAVESTSTKTVFTKLDSVGRVESQLEIHTPTVGGVPLSYTRLAAWSQPSYVDASSFVISSITDEFAVFGVRTKAGDLPTSGEATYTVEGGGAIYSGGKFYMASTSSGMTASFTANFGAGTIATSLGLVGVEYGTSNTMNFGTASATGTIASGGPGFSGTFSGGTTGSLEGAFFGPQAAEMAYQYFVDGGSFTGVGALYGKKP